MKNYVQPITLNMKINHSTVYKPGIYENYDQDGIEILRDNLLLDFTGVVLVGGKKEKNAFNSQNSILHEEFSYDDKTEEDARVEQLGFFGTGLRLTGLKNVTIKGITLKGFELAVCITHCENITLMDCNFSDNFHDPECGWNEHDNKGAIYLNSSHNCTIKHNRANNIWNGIYLYQSNYNTIIENNFSFASNMCVKLWNSCHNIIDSNNLSWGLRIKSGEVHARDSAGLLMDSGCDYNIVKNNDITHGGDGLFLRVLNGWHSRFNLFENNDCSYANNNAIEAWADSNTYIRNKANYSSYGFWMGGSDNTVMFENEACNNGKVFSNAPESFGNCGVAVVNGSGHNFKMIGNKLCDNNGPGMAVRFEKKYPVFHWVIEDNEICNNKSCNRFIGHGIYLKNCGLISISNNTFENNDGENICYDDNVFDIIKLESGDDFVSIRPYFPNEFVKQGELLAFGCEALCQSNSVVNVRWDFGDTITSQQVNTKKIYDTYGTFYVGITASSKSRSSICGKIVNVVPIGTDISTLIKTATLNSDDLNATLTASPERIQCSSECCKQLIIKSSLSDEVTVAGNTHFSFFLKIVSDAQTDWDCTVPSPIVTLSQDNNNKIIITPKRMTADGLFIEKTWEKFEYRFITMPISKSDKDFIVEVIGAPIKITQLSINISYKNQGKVAACIRHCMLNTVAKDCIAENVARNDFPRLIEFPKLTCSESKTKNPHEILSEKNIYLSDGTGRFVANSENSYVIVDFGKEVVMHGVQFIPYSSSGETAFDLREQFPKTVTVAILQGEAWVTVAKTSDIVKGCNMLNFNDIAGQQIKLDFTGENSSIWKLVILGEQMLPQSQAVEIKELLFKTHIESDGKGDTLSDMVLSIYETEDNKPCRKPIYTVILSKEKVKSGKVDKVTFNKLVLPHGKYCITFSQVSLAKSRTDGEYYRFPAAKQMLNEYSGALANGEYKDETEVWGNLWIYLVTDHGVIDYSNESEGLGVRAGFLGSEERYQTFTI